MQSVNPSLILRPEFSEAVVRKGSLYKVQVSLERREDGGLRAWSEDVPELVLSHSDADAVLADLPRALQVILSERLGQAVEIAELRLLPAVSALVKGVTPALDRREFAARVAA